MTDTILVLAEDALSETDVRHLVSLHPGDDVAFRVLIPADTERNPITSFIDYLSLGYLKEAWEEVTKGEPDEGTARRTAANQLTDTLAAFETAGATASGEVTEDDPVPVAARLVAAGGVLEVAVLTYPHAVEDTFHTDWASRARDDMQVPVLHVYLGTSELG